MPKYFDYLPHTIYRGRKVTDITAKSDMTNEAMKDMVLMMPYNVEDGEKPEDFAYNYYGTIDYYWLNLMANNMYNYYEDWVKSDLVLERYIIDKYKEISGRVGYDVVMWTMSVSLLDNILYFFDEDGNILSTDTVIIDNVPNYHWEKRHTEDGQKFLLETFININPNIRPFRIYEYEILNNESKRDIIVVNKAYVGKVLSDFTKSME